MPFTARVAEHNGLNTIELVKGIDQLAPIMMAETLMGELGVMDRSRDR